MKRKVSTSIEQGERLLALGIDPDTTADMVWKHERDGEEYKVCPIDGRYHKGLFADRYKYTRPAWSLGALLRLLPDVIRTENSLGKWFYTLHILKDRIEYGSRSDDGSWSAMISDSEENLIDAACNILCWLAANKFLEQGKEDGV